MLRVLGMFGLGIGFLIISPGLRGSLVGDFETFGTAMSDYSPISYVGLFLVVLGGLMFMIYRTSQPR